MYSPKLIDHYEHPRNVGALDKDAADVGTGIVFGPAQQAALEAGLQRAGTLWADQESWAAVQRNGMAANVGWERSAKLYAALYRGD